MSSSNQVLVAEINKLNGKLDAMREELVASKKKEIPADSLAVSFASIVILAEHPESVAPAAVVAMLYNNGCRPNASGVWCTPFGESIKYCGVELTTQFYPFA